jgi:ABC-type polysaccharide/polyol phosphate export permease
MQYEFQQKTADLTRYRELLWNLVSRDIKVRYKRSVLGLFWTVLQPVLMTLVFTIVFSSGFRNPAANAPLYFISGYTLWNFFAQTTTQSMMALRSHGALMKHVALPKSVFVVSTLVTSLVTLVFSLIPLFALILLSSHPITPVLLLLPVPILLTSLFTLGVALVLAPLALFFDDLNHFFQVMLTMWFFLTPVVYFITVIPPEYQFLIQLNPMAWMLELFRAPVYYGVLPDLTTLLAGTVAALTALALGWWSFMRFANRFVYYL